MREIKFRAYCKTSESWKYGYLVRGTYTTTNWYIYQGSADKYLINQQTIGQYTGLKDKNNKEIYEGDVVKRVKYLGIVIFEKGAFKIKWKSGVFDYYPRYIEDYKKTSLEVVGNIYENEELNYERK